MEEVIVYAKISHEDYDILTKIMTEAFNEDTRIHTNLKEDGPKGYNDGRLIRILNESVNYESYEIIYNDNIIGGYTIEILPNYEYRLEMLFIDPLYRGNHFGSNVWSHIEKEYPDAKKWTVETPSYSKRNHYFYIRKCGFTFKEEKVYENGEKSIIFEK